MTSIIDQIDNRELVVRVLHRGKQTPVKEQDKLAAELIELAQIGERMRWIPVSEELPEKGQICDIFFQFANGVRRVCEVTFTSKAKGFDHGVFPLDGVTHWRLSEADRPGGD